MQIRLHNTLTRSVDPLVPTSDGEIRMYTCGPTVYRPVHVEMTARGRRVLGKGRDLRIADIEGRVRRLGPQGIATLERAVGIIEGMLRD